MARFAKMPCSEFDKGKILDFLPRTPGEGRGKSKEEIVKKTGISGEQVTQCLRALKKEGKAYCRKEELWRQNKQSTRKMLRQLKRFFST